ncbi:alpha-xenorhabdolysin family binary toxin subunit A [Pseudomonas sp. B21-047]|uniref:alpha-xenorhabdolysin family binary toxin subunit A n=1 Tax=Pseudomonas sp. B21-047 TaxID=2895489 RepID=UPI002160C103|nr:alpha-xenorhabdolysin family binary toxin subunit A [Pseudomonas sp. B21-047]UVL02925.1 alpha-xenorhabdolysin family binary toxin subunit A [Pseudomonas sp. B21-047]
MGNSSVDNVPFFKGSGAQHERKPFEELTEEQRAILIPSQIFKLKAKEPAFIFSRENLIAIKRYGDKVRQLPTPARVSEIEVLSDLGLEAEDINAFFNNLRAHVDTWDDIEDSCKKMGAELQIFAENLIQDGVNLLAIIKNLDAWDSLPEDSAVLATLTLSAFESKTFNEGVDAHLAGITQDIADKLESIRQVKKLIDRFGDTITNHLVPTARSLLDNFKSHDAADRLKSIEDQLVQLDGDIKRKLDEYNGLVGAAFYGLVFGPLGLLVTGGIYGAQAETVRAQKNVLIKQHEQLSVNKDVLLGGGVKEFEGIKAILNDMQFRLVDVSTATKNLEDVWVLLEAYATNSLKKVKRVSTQLELKQFAAGFERVITPWRDILGITKKLSELFNETLRGD